MEMMGYLLSAYKIERYCTKSWGTVRPVPLTSFYDNLMDVNLIAKALQKSDDALYAATVRKILDGVHDMKDYVKEKKHHKDKTG